MGLITDCIFRIIVDPGWLSVLLYHGSFLYSGTISLHFTFLSVCVSTTSQTNPPTLGRAISKEWDYLAATWAAFALSSGSSLWSVYSTRTLVSSDGWWALSSFPGLWGCVTVFVYCAYLASRLLFHLICCTPTGLSALRNLNLCDPCSRNSRIYRIEPMNLHDSGCRMWMWLLGLLLVWEGDIPLHSQKIPVLFCCKLTN